MRQITIESPLPPGKHVATTLGCNNISRITLSTLNGTGGGLPRNELDGCVGDEGFDF